MDVTAHCQIYVSQHYKAVLHRLHILKHYPTNTDYGQPQFLGVFQFLFYLTRIVLLDV